MFERETESVLVNYSPCLCNYKGKKEYFVCEYVRERARKYQ